MERKTIKIKISGGEFEFSERNKKDVDYSSLHKKLMEQRFNFIQTTVKDPELQTAMLMNEIEKTYTPQQISIYIYSNKEEQLKLIYDSFKIKNTEIEFEKFKEFISDDELDKVVSMINTLEGSTIAERNTEFSEYLNNNPEMLLTDFANILSISNKQKLAEIIYSEVVKKKAV